MVLAVQWTRCFKQLPSLPAQVTLPEAWFTKAIKTPSQKSKMFLNAE